MRFVTMLLLWLVTTVALAVAVPSAWAQKTVIDPNGYSEFAAFAAKDPVLQAAMANVLTTQFTSLASDRGYDLNPNLVHNVAAAYTGNAGFPGQFAQANRIAHRWMFTDLTPHGDSEEEWLIDIAPMLSDSSFRATLGGLDIDVPQTLTVPITVSSPELRPGQLRQLARWGPWVSVGAAILTGIFALLTLAAARARGKALAALGISALLVGAAGWAGVEVARRYVTDALNRTSGEIRHVAEAMIDQAEGSLHHWFNLTLAAGGVLVVFGAIVSMLAGLRGKSTKAR